MLTCVLCSSSLSFLFSFTFLTCCHESKLTCILMWNLLYFRFPLLFLTCRVWHVCYVYLYHFCFLLRFLHVVMNRCRHAVKLSHLHQKKSINVFFNLPNPCWGDPLPVGWHVCYVIFLYHILFSFTFLACRHLIRNISVMKYYESILTLLLRDIF